MKILVIGGTGFIGSALVGRLVGSGHRVRVAVRSRNRIARKLPAELTVIDLAAATDPEDWRELLQGIDAVAYCAGVLQSSSTGTAAAVHIDAPSALYRACLDANVKRVVHLSAIGVDDSGYSNFSLSKKEGDNFLRSTELDWVILRPSVVFGEPAYGGSALFRGLASLPITPKLSWSGEIQPVQLSDLLSTIEFFLSAEAPARVTIEIAGNDKLSTSEIVAAYRRWLGHKPARVWSVPYGLAALGGQVGDLLGRLGWRPPVRTNAIQELRRGATGDPSEWIMLTGIEPESFSDALTRRPASVQEYWFSQLYFLKPLVIFVFGLFWIATGVISLGPGWERGIALLDGSFLQPIAAPSVIGGALMDITLGVAIMWRPTCRLALYAALGVSLFYALMGTLVQPVLWADPLGPMLKIWPIMVLNLVALAILDDR